MRHENVHGSNGANNKEPGAVNHWFHRFACKTADIMGSAWAFFGAIGIIVAWAFLGPIFHYSDSWQLVINTGTTIITFLMVFLIQNTQNRDAKAFHLKLNELILAIKGARNRMMNLEDMTDDELAELKKQFDRISGSRQQQRPSPHHQKQVAAK